MNVYEGTVVSSRAYRADTSPFETFRVDYEISGPGGRYIFTQYSRQERPAVAPGSRVRFSWWSLAASAAGTIHEEWCDMGNRLASRRAAETLARKHARRSIEKGANIEYIAYPAPNDWRWGVFALLPAD
jgi:hypothetical protein